MIIVLLKSSHQEKYHSHTKSECKHANEREVVQKSSETNVDVYRRKLGFNESIREEARTQKLKFYNGFVELLGGKS